MTDINSEVNWISGQAGGAERASYGGGGLQNVGYKSPVLSLLECSRKIGPYSWASSTC